MKKKQRQGFTIIELSLSMIFIGILSLALTYIIANTLASYRRGLILNHVNQTGQAIVDDVRAAIQNSSGESVMALCDAYYTDNDRENCLKDGARSFIHLEKKASNVGGVPGVASGLGNLPAYGIFCAGDYTYLWASGYYEMPGVIVYGAERPTYNGKNYRLLKVTDQNRAICKSIVRKCNGSLAAGGCTSYTRYENAATLGSELQDYLSDPNNAITVNADLYGNVGEDVEVLNPTEAADLVLYTFDINNPAESATEKNAFYSGSFILGTKDGGMNIKATGKTCDAPEEYNSNFDYCAINKFSFAAQTNGEIYIPNL